MTAVLLALLALLVVPVLGLGGADDPETASENMVVLAVGGCAGQPQAISEATGVPGPALFAYCSAAGRYRVDWAVLAAIGNQECDHGRSRMAGCNPRGTVNAKGARGPMQFLGSTWRAGAGVMDPDVSGPAIPEGEEAKGYASDGDGDGVADPWSFVDAAYGAARLLKRNGVEQNVEAAVYAYNPSPDYVSAVIATATRYRRQTAGLTGPLDVGNGSAQAFGGTERVVEGHITPTLQHLLDAVVPVFGRGMGIGCYRSQEDGGEHPRGRACDFMMAHIGTRPDPKWLKHGNQMAQWLITNADRLHVRYIIWQQHIWHVDQPHWRLMEDRGSITQNHYDHIHVSVQYVDGDPVY